MAVRASAEIGAFLYLGSAVHGKPVMAAHQGEVTEETGPEADGYPGEEHGEEDDQEQLQAEAALTQQEGPHEAGDDGGGEQNQQQQQASPPEGNFFPGLRQGFPGHHPFLLPRRRAAPADKASLHGLRHHGPPVQRRLALPFPPLFPGGPPRRQPFAQQPHGFGDRAQAGLLAEAGLRPSQGLDRAFEPRRGGQREGPDIEHGPVTGGEPIGFSHRRSLKKSVSQRATPQMGVLAQPARGKPRSSTSPSAPRPLAGAERAFRAVSSFFPAGSGPGRRPCREEPRRTGATPRYRHSSPDAVR